MKHATKAAKTWEISWDSPQYIPLRILWVGTEVLDIHLAKGHCVANAHGLREPLALLLGLSNSIFQIFSWSDGRGWLATAGFHWGSHRLQRPTCQHVMLGAVIVQPPHWAKEERATWPTSRQRYFLPGCFVVRKAEKLKEILNAALPICLNLRMMFSEDRSSQVFYILKNKKTAGKIGKIRFQNVFSPTKFPPPEVVPSAFRQMWRHQEGEVGLAGFHGSPWPVEKKLCQLLC